jgi:hypothetical protein
MKSEPLSLPLETLGSMERLFLIIALLVAAMLVAGCTAAPRSSYNYEADPTTATPPPALITDYRDPQPPEEDDDSLSLGEIVTFRDAGEENEISLKVVSSTDRGSYEPAGESIKITAPQGWRYLFVHVVITHRGHRGDGYRTTIYAPPAQQFSLVDDGRTYYPVPVQADHLVNIGEVYHGDKWVDRNGKYEGYIVYKVPESVVDSDAVVVANIVGLKNLYGRDYYNFRQYDKNPAWRL